MTLKKIKFYLTQLEGSFSVTANVVVGQSYGHQQIIQSKIDYTYINIKQFKLSLLFGSLAVNPFQLVLVGFIMQSFFFFWLQDGKLNMDSSVPPKSSFSPASRFFLTRHSGLKEMLTLCQDSHILSSKCPHTGRQDQNAATTETVGLGKKSK